MAADSTVGRLVKWAVGSIVGHGDRISSLSSDSSFPLCSPSLFGLGVQNECECESWAENELS